MQVLSIRAKTRIHFLRLIIQYCFQTITLSHGVNCCSSEPQLLMGKCYSSGVPAMVEKMFHHKGGETIIGLLLDYIQFY